MHSLKLSIYLLSALFLSACSVDTTPSWLEIPAINLSTDEPIEGVNSHQITDAWVYMDGKAIGVFELPCRIPILAEGEHAFIIYAGVIRNGISATRIKYPFYERHETNLNLVKGETVTITPTVTYKKNLKFELFEDFEDPGNAFGNADVSQTSLQYVAKADEPEIVKYGIRCGGIFLTETDSIFKALTSTFLELPRNEDVFLEIDFLSDNSIVTGVIAQNATDYNEHPPYIQINPQGTETLDWRKVYIDLREDVSFEIYATSYEIYLWAVRDPDNTSAAIYLDNIKVIRYQ